LNKYDFKIIFENDKFILNKNKIFVIKEYLCDDLFKINIITKMNKDDNNNNNIIIIIIIYP
jgi:hypothetical protein